MICKLRKNDYPEIELLFGEQYIGNYLSDVYNLYEFEQVDSFLSILIFINNSYKKKLKKKRKNGA